MTYEPWQCQRCGACIGYLGRFMRGLLGRRLYARLIGCRMDADGAKGPEHV
jgi:hypothetical protein